MAAASASAKPHYEGDPNEVELVGPVIKIKPRGLDIIWGNDKRYWRIPTKNDNGSAELIQVCWLEVTALLPLSRLQVGKKYNVRFDVSLKADAFGWNKQTPLYLAAKIGKKGKYKLKSSSIASSPEAETINISLGEPLEINEDEKNSGGMLYFGLYELGGRWKGGLLIKEARVEQID
ncbi:hypothetical protein IFM89_025198 [Coptis chinensis]|uniref:Phloem protein 2 n=1 Tax=Coptis chinensis TaxID=261450 RepID=A0A835I662_9MAGN|nr:hypothetical protein IFM89_025198 [Coptis chinensis]